MDSRPQTAKVKMTSKIFNKLMEQKYSNIWPNVRPLSTLHNERILSNQLPKTCSKSICEKNK